MNECPVAQFLLTVYTCDIALRLIPTHHACNIWLIIKRNKILIMFIYFKHIWLILRITVSILYFGLFQTSIKVSVLFKTHVLTVLWGEF